MKSKIRRELAWICLPLILFIGMGAWISRDQNARNARQRQLDSGPSRVLIRSIETMQGQDKEGYRYGMNIIGHIEGAPLTLPPGKIWVLRAKSARIGDGKTSKKVRIVNDISPVDGDNLPRTDVWAVAQVVDEPHEVRMWLYCDSALTRPVLDLELEAVQGTLAPRPNQTWPKHFTASGARLTAPVEKIPLHKWNQNNEKANFIKGEY